MAADTLLNHWRTNMLLTLPEINLILQRAHCEVIRGQIYVLESQQYIAEMTNKVS